MKKVRVRYAPSPTGLLHIGNARTAMFNYLFARHHKGDFIIRIEDTDIARNVKGGEASQLDNLKWLGLDWDESPDKGGLYGPYRQLERLDLYKKYADDLLERGLAYKEYKEGSDYYAVRFKVPEAQTYCFEDMVRGSLSFESKDIEDWIILKDNGIPTYNFAVVVDDHFMKITHVFRGEEHITNTPKQIMVYQAFGWEIPLFGHMTLIVNEERKKLSKRDHSIVQFIGQYRDLGYLPQALFNFISLLGWSPSINEEILSQDQIIELFDADRLTKAPSFFDVDKLTFINHTYIKKLSDEAFVEFIRPFLVSHGVEIKDEVWLSDLASLLHDRCEYGAQIVELYDEFFKADFAIEAEALNFIKEETTTLSTIKQFKLLIKDIDFEPELIQDIIKQTGKDVGVKGKNLYMPCRIATTGNMHGPELPKMLSLLGKQTIMDRINYTISLLEEQK